MIDMDFVKKAVWFGLGGLAGYGLGTLVEQFASRRREIAMGEFLDDALGRLGGGPHLRSSSGSKGAVINESVVAWFEQEAKREVGLARQLLESGDHKDARLHVGKAVAYADMAKVAAKQMGFADLSAAASEVGNDATVMLQKIDQADF
jgi:hypothetical protein